MLGAKSRNNFQSIRQSNNSITNSIRPAKNFHNMNQTLEPSFLTKNFSSTRKPPIDIIERKRNYHQLYNSIEMNRRSFKKHILNGSLVTEAP